MVGGWPDGFEGIMAFQVTFLNSFVCNESMELRPPPPPHFPLNLQRNKSNSIESKTDRQTDSKNKNFMKWVQKARGKIVSLLTDRRQQLLMFV